MTDLEPLAGSFRDPAARVYLDGDAILRGVDAVTLANFRALSQLDFFRQEAGRARIVGTRALDEDDPRSIAIKAQGWAGALEHDRVPFLSYPYEWTFSMLKDAALLHLDLLEESLKAGWVIKDSTPYNIQFMGSAPAFIDIPSFVRRPPGDYWRGYRQFCMLFLYPLLLTAHRGIPFQGLLRASLDGLSPARLRRSSPASAGSDGAFFRTSNCRPRSSAAQSRRAPTAQPKSPSLNPTQWCSAWCRACGAS